MTCHFDLHDNNHSYLAFSIQVFARIKTLATKPDALRCGISASDAAMTLGIAPAMAKEHLLTAESKGRQLHNLFWAWFWSVEV